jgi:hypothetical protein
MKATIDRLHLTRALAACSLALLPGDKGYRGRVLITLDTDEVVLAACNGHWLAQWRERTLAGPRVTYQPGAEPAEPAAPTACPAPPQMLLPCDSVAELRAWLKARGKTGAVEIDSAGIFECDCKTLPVTLAAAFDYPPLDSVIEAAVNPKPTTAPHAIALDGDYLAAIVKAFKLADERPIFRFGGSDEPVLVRDVRGSLTCVLMTVNMHVAESRAS